MPPRKRLTEGDSVNTIIRNPLLATLLIIGLTGSAAALAGEIHGAPAGVTATNTGQNDDGFTWGAGSAIPVIE
jgi:hypothetical protein